MQLNINKKNADFVLLIQNQNILTTNTLGVDLWRYTDSNDDNI